MSELNILFKVLYFKIARSDRVSMLTKPILPLPPLPHDVSESFMGQS